MIAAIYARKSTDQSGVSDDARSVTRQIERASAYAQSRGWAVAKEYIYVDDGISGAEFAKRPGLLRLMAALKPAPPFQVLIMSEESRLGREAIETAFALKTLIVSGVRVFFYLEDRERTLDTPTDKIMMSLTAFADEAERERARQRTYDALKRKAESGHVTGGRCFGYRNHEVTGPDGQRSHVERRVHEPEAETVRLIFERYDSGWGHSRIAKTLNEEGAPSPRAQQGRPNGWAPSSVRAVLHRPIYRGEIVWNKSRKRNAWGQKQPAARPEAEWLRTSAPELQIVPEELAIRVDERLHVMGSRTRRSPNVGRPPGRGVKYLLTGMLTCSVCGSSFEALSRKHGRRRAFVYGCAAHRRRGRRICPNDLVVPMEVADEAVLDAIEGTLLRPEVIDRTIEKAEAALATNTSVERRRQLKKELTSVGEEIERLTAAIAGGASDVTALVEAMRTREERQKALDSELSTLDMRRAEFDGSKLRQKLQQRLSDWRALLRRHPIQGHQVLQNLIDGRLTFEPKVDGDERYYTFTGTGTMEALLGGEVVQKLASPRATDTSRSPIFSIGLDFDGAVKLAA